MLHRALAFLPLGLFAAMTCLSPLNAQTAAPPSSGEPVVAEKPAVPVEEQNVDVALEPGVVGDNAELDGTSAKPAPPPPPAAASSNPQPDETLPGFEPLSAYASSPIDAINLSNGDVNATIGLGPTYPLGPATTFRLQAISSAKLWRMIDDAETCTQYPNLSLRRAGVRGYPTVGVGWTLDPGHLAVYTGTTPVTPKVYYSPDGGRHALSGGLTYDGSHLRVTCSSATSCTVEFPDGTVETFAHPYKFPTPSAGSSGDFGGEDWGDFLGLTSITHRLSGGTQLLNVSYVASEPSLNAWRISQITLNPGTSQARTIGYTWSTLKIGTLASDPTWPILTQLSLPAAAGTSHALLATFGFDPTTPTFTRIIFDNTVGKNSLCNPDSATVQVPFLTNITLADAAAPGTVLQRYSFAYYLPGATQDNRVAVLTHIGLPTGGTLDYTYDPSAAQAIGVPTDLETTSTTTAPINASSLDDPTTGSSGDAGTCGGYPPVTFWAADASITARLEKLTSTDLGSTNQYARTDFLPLNSCSANPYDIIHRMIVTTPTGNSGTPNRATKYLFAGPLEIERREYADTNYGGTPIRTTVGCYDGDTTFDGLATHCGFLQNSTTLQSYGISANVRQQASITWYGTNPTPGGTCTAGSVLCTGSVNTQSSYNTTAGHYGSTVISSTLTGNGWTSRTNTTAWTPQTGSVWLLDLYSSKTTTDAGTSLPSPTTTTSSYAFNTTTSLLNTVTTNDTISGVASSLTQGFQSGDGFGNPTTTTASGSGKVDTTTFTDTRSFQSGLVTSSQRTGVPWKSFDVTREINAGAITTSRDPNQLATAYSYDALGRLTSLTPPGEVATSMTYNSPTQVTVARSGESWRRFFYDGLGRVTREFRQLPTGYAARYHQYDQAHHEIFLSEWKACATATLLGDCGTLTAPGTTWSKFDPFGRPQTITLADGTVTSISYADGAITYSDSLESTTQTVSGASATTRVRKDGLGRMISVQEPTVGTSTPTTTYAYNVLDKVGTVVQASGAQTRTFTYDRFCFLRSQQNPEKGASGNGTTTYSQYDALGDLRTRVDGGITFTSAFDTAGRLLSLSTNETSHSGSYLANTYDASWSSANYSYGKLSSRTASNYALSSAGNTTSDALTYGGVGGRISSQTTTVNAGTAVSATQGWSYNTLGQLATRTYPCSSGSFPVTYTYSMGLPTSITANGTSIVSATTYSPSGLLASWTTGNGVVTSIAQASSLLPRPAQITVTSGATTFFDSGLYGYDGAGNILTIGADTLKYDGRSRITSATYSGFSPAQTFTYDDLGNLTNVAGQNPRSLGTSTSTNHLSAATYDAFGSLKTFGTETLTYDGLGRQIEDNTAGVDWKYLYDGANERAARVPTSGSTFFTLRDHVGHVATEFAGTAVGRDNIFLGNLMVASFVSSSLSGTPGWQYYHADHLGSPRVVTNASAQVVETRKYWPFGDEVAGTTASPQKLRFATMERDLETSHFYDHARAHDFSLCRFVSLDPVDGSLTSAESWNRYTYASNNPLRFIDPFGLSDNEGSCTMGTQGATNCGQSHDDPGLNPFTQQIDQHRNEEIISEQAAKGSFFDSAKVDALRNDPVLDLAATMQTLKTPVNVLAVGSIAIPVVATGVGQLAMGSKFAWVAIPRGGTIVLGRFQQHLPQLLSLATAKGGRAILNTLPQVQELFEDYLKGEIDLATKIYFRVVGVTPDSISGRVELPHILSSPDLLAKTDFIFK